MPVIVMFILVFAVIGLVFVLANLLLGKLVRPNKPSQQKGDIYECGEETVGNTWIQFDLRFYVVALLFVIFDVEMAFLFPWGVVFGDASRVAQSASEYSTAAKNLAVLAFVEFIIFFGILLVGYAYLWKRGDLAWVRSTKNTVPFKEQPARE